MNSDNQLKSTALKEKGNECFKNGNYEKAIEYYSQAILIEPNDHILYSNRSASYLNINKNELALKDAQICIALNSTWWKGYHKKGLALLELGKFDEALDSLKEGLKQDKGNSVIKNSIKEVEQKKIEKSHYMSIERNGKDIILTPNEGYDGILIFLHGLGDSASGYQDMFFSENRPIPKRLKVILLTAPKSQVTINMGMSMTSWFDIKDLGKFSISEEEAQNNAYKIMKLIDDESKNTI